MTTVSENYTKTEQIPFPEIYLFQAGSTIARYTSWDEDLTFEGYVYQSRPIKRSSFSQDTQMGKATVDISAAVFDIMLNYISNAPVEPLQVTIKRLVLDDLTQQVVIFTGESSGITFKDRTATVRFEANSSILNTMLPRWICKSQCNHNLFDSYCKKLQLSYTVTSTVGSVGGDGSLTIPGLDASGFTFVAGFVTIGSDKRLITDQSVDTIILHVPFYQVAVGAAAIVVAGCDKSVDTCENVYDNLDNFLGMLTIPSRNPTVYGAI